MNIKIPEGMELVGWQMRYQGWAKGSWQFLPEHPGPLPEIHADRYIRPVFAPKKGHEHQKTWRKPYEYSPYDL